MDNKVLAIVNGREITEKDIQVAIERFPVERQQYLYTEQGRNQILDQMISFELLYSYGKDNDLEKNEMYLKDVEDVKKELLVKTAIDNVFSDISVNDQELEEYYKENKEKFKSEESVTASHILVQDEDKAKDIKAKLDQGMAFEDAAKEYSSCPSKEQGGALGNFTRGAMVPEFEEAAFGLEIGVISDPVKTQFGYHIIRVDERSEQKQMPFEVVKDKIKDDAIKEKQNVQYVEFLKDLKSKYEVKIK